MVFLLENADSNQVLFLVRATVTPDEWRTNFEVNHVSAAAVCKLLLMVWHSEEAHRGASTRSQGVQCTSCMQTTDRKIAAIFGEDAGIAAGFGSIFSEVRQAGWEEADTCAGEGRARDVNAQRASLLAARRSQGTGGARRSSRMRHEQAALTSADHPVALGRCTILPRLPCACAALA